jgi:hypothetical protein
VTWGSQTRRDRQDGIQAISKQPRSDTEFPNLASFLLRSISVQFTPSSELSIANDSRFCNGSDQRHSRYYREISANGDNSVVVDISAGCCQLNHHPDREIRGPGESTGEKLISRDGGQCNLDSVEGNWRGNRGKILTLDEPEEGKICGIARKVRREVRIK